MLELNHEKQEVLKADGNILVTANPGSGKTRLLAYKFLSAVQNGMNPESILCLTFTDKAKKEMQSRIIRLLIENKIKFNPVKLNIYTFHSYALDNIEESKIVSSNLLRFIIFEYLKKHQVFTYADSHLLEKIVPKIETLIRYLKTFGITPEQIDISKTKSFLEDDKKFSKKEKEKYAEEFVKIFELYERIKEDSGIDYADLLMEFLALPNIPQFELVLIDELQDVNRVEADIALKSARNFFAVGDRKQAIFGFQGGSILNFEKFQNSEKFVLSDNFRSTDQILNYAREYFIGRTEDDSHRDELKDLKSYDGKSGEMPVLYEINPKSIQSAVLKVLNQNIKENVTIAVLTRTNSQLSVIAKELMDNGISFSTTYMGASSDAKTNIIRFLKGIISNDIYDIKKALLTPFSPVSLQEAFDIFEEDELTLDRLEELAPDFMSLRDSVKTIEDLNNVYRKIILPIASSYGREYLTAAKSMLDVFHEALKFIENINIDNLSAYLETSELPSDDLELKSQITLSTIHKAKGREFDTVIYLPTNLKDQSNFQDEVVEAILQTQGIDVKEELEEESLRINFVAFTRARTKLIILSSDISEFINEYSVEDTIESEEHESPEFTDSIRKAYSFFLNKNFDKANELLTTNNNWLISYVSEHFKSLDRLSYSAVKDNPFKYFEQQILGLYFESTSMAKGLDVHSIAEKLVKEEKFNCPQDLISHKKNIESLINSIRKKYPNAYSTEYKFKIPLDDILPNDQNVAFVCKIDSIFRNRDKYLIVDWKTDRDTGYSSNHRQQLEVYKRGFCVHEQIDPESVEVAIGFISLRDKVNTGKFDYLLDDKQPAESAFNTFSNKILQILNWRMDPDQFFQDLIKKPEDDILWRSIVEQYKVETS